MLTAAVSPQVKNNLRNSDSEEHSKLIDESGSGPAVVFISWLAVCKRYVLCGGMLPPLVLLGIMLRDHFFHCYEEARDSRSRGELEAGAIHYDFPDAFLELRAPWASESP